MERLATLLQQTKVHSKSCRLKRRAKSNHSLEVTNPDLEELQRYIEKSLEEMKEKSDKINSQETGVSSEDPLAKEKLELERQRLKQEHEKLELEAKNLAFQKKLYEENTAQLKVEVEYRVPDCQTTKLSKKKNKPKRSKIFKQFTHEQRMQLWADLTGEESRLTEETWMIFKLHKSGDQKFIEKCANQYSLPKMSVIEMLYVPCESKTVFDFVAYSTPASMSAFSFNCNSQMNNIKFYLPAIHHAAQKVNTKLSLWNFIISGEEPEQDDVSVDLF
jgi:hypothetical protein